jgi:hypothetical protein
MKKILLSMTMVFSISVAPAQNPGVKPDPSLSEYIYTAPQGWTTMQYANGIELRSNTSENCTIRLYPMRPSSEHLRQSGVDTVFFRADAILPKGHRKSMGARRTSKAIATFLPRLCITRPPAK